jgi:hypothetical protein
MKTALLLLCTLGLSSPVIAGADAPAVLLMKPELAGQAGAQQFDRAIVGEMSIKADSIILDDTARTLTCTGSVRIAVKGTVATCEQCKLQIPAASQISILNPNGVALSKDTKNAPVTLPELDTSLHH